MEAAGSGQWTVAGGESGKKVPRDSDPSQGFQSAERSRISVRSASRGPPRSDASVDSNRLECRQCESGVCGAATHSSIRYNSIFVTPRNVSRSTSYAVRLGSPSCSPARSGQTELRCCSAASAKGSCLSLRATLNSSPRAFGHASWSLRMLATRESSKPYACSASATIASRANLG